MRMRGGVCVCAFIEGALQARGDWLVLVLLVLALVLVLVLVVVYRRRGVRRR